MINRLVKLITGKEIIFINPHRNSSPLINPVNRAAYYFVNPAKAWKFTAVFGKDSTWRYRAMGLFLSIVSPRYIIDINWISRLQTIFFVWCRNHNRQFIVVQHGSYAAGLISDIPHRIAKCQVFFAWSVYFKELLESYNTGKKVKCIAWGNPVYNQYNRDDYAYNRGAVKKVLIAPSLVWDERMEHFKAVMQKVHALGFEVTVKQHAFQPVKSVSFDLFPIAQGDIFSILKSREYDLVITDTSSAMNDIIFFKTRVIYCSPPAPQDYYNHNVYSTYLKNIALTIHQMNSAEELVAYCDIDAQERLFQQMVLVGNSNDLSNLKNYLAN